MGHSIGAAIALAIAAQSQRPFPVLGVSALGVIPTPRSDLLIPDPDPEPDEPRSVIDDVPEVVNRSFGPFECLNEEVFTRNTLEAVFEPSGKCSIDVPTFIGVDFLYQVYVRREIRESTGPEWYRRLLHEVFLAVKLFQLPSTPSAGLNQSGPDPIPCR